MHSIDRESLLRHLNWRYATKQFDPQRKISPEDWATLQEALVLTPSSFGLQPWRFILVRDQAKREQLVPASWGQRQVADASHLVVFAIKTNITQSDIDAFVERIVEVRGAARESLTAYRELMISTLLKSRGEMARRLWAANQVYIALGNFLTCAALLGIDACPMEGIEPAKYDAVLGLGPQGLATVLAAAAGYRAATDKHAQLKKVRFPKADLFAEV